MTRMGDESHFCQQFYVRFTNKLSDKKYLSVSFSFPPPIRFSPLPPHSPACRPHRGTAPSRQTTPPDTCNKHTHPPPSVDHPPSRQGPHSTSHALLRATAPTPADPSPLNNHARSAWSVESPWRIAAHRLALVAVVARRTRPSSRTFGSGLRARGVRRSVRPATNRALSRIGRRRLPSVGSTRRRWSRWGWHPNVWPTRWRHLLDFSVHFDEWALNKYNTFIQWLKKMCKDNIEKCVEILCGFCRQTIDWHFSVQF